MDFPLVAGPQLFTTVQQVLAPIKCGTQECQRLSHSPGKDVVQSKRCSEPVPHHDEAGPIERMTIPRLRHEL
jgi:hypothetical protein